MLTAGRNRWRKRVLMVALAAGCAVCGCSDRLAEMQANFEGTWVLESRELPDGTLFRSPQVTGNLTWASVDSRKAHVSIYVLQEGQGEETPRTFDYAASTYEISTSAITRKRHLLIRQGYRSSEALPVTVYKKDKTSKGKISVSEGVVTVSHEEGFSQVFEGDHMVAVYPGTFTDTWRRLK